MKLSLPRLNSDVVLLIARVVLGVVLFAHGWQKLILNGIAGTYGQFDKLGIPLAIVSASFVTVVEFVGGVLLVVGALTRVVVGLHILVMIGAASFVHVSRGIFASDGGWELVGVIAACELVIAAVGAGKYSIDHLLSSSRDAAVPPPVPVPVPEPASAFGGGAFGASPRHELGREPGRLPTPYPRTRRPDAD